MTKGQAAYIVSEAIPFTVCAFTEPRGVCGGGGAGD